ncbi:hypothetical protein JOD64_000348 [Micromonospora luteifusca]|uniref:Uncharacterized protein n=1 Tax=Micromonospora luteifusca TaxID=709860 RepID=A0ABS2LLT1_9ACTN|nr:hypothetical protein [Micromonospora luteifusca]MBM7489126.1 hypothetical protein [Micromonospora luteifusca]
MANVFVHVLHGMSSVDEERLLRAGLERLGYGRPTEKIDKTTPVRAARRLTSGRLRFDQEGRLTHADESHHSYR